MIYNQQEDGQFFVQQVVVVGTHQGCGAFDATSAAHTHVTGRA